MFSLADKWGCSVRELGQRVSSAELTEWIAYYELEHDESQGKVKPTRDNIAAAMGIKVVKKGSR